MSKQAPDLPRETLHLLQRLNDSFYVHARGRTEAPVAAPTLGWAEDTATRASGWTQAWDTISHDHAWDAFPLAIQADAVGGQDRPAFLQ